MVIIGFEFVVPLIYELLVGKDKILFVILSSVSNTVPAISSAFRDCWLI